MPRKKPTPPAKELPTSQPENLQNQQVAAISTLDQVDQPIARASRNTDERRAYARTLKAQARFLRSFRRHGIVGKASEEAMVGRSTVHLWQTSDERFATLYRQAVAQAADRLEAEARRRAEEGWREPVFQKGRKVGHIRKYSDALMITLLKGMKPEVYKDRVESSVSMKTTAIVDASSSSDAELAARIASAMQVLKLAGAASTLPVIEAKAITSGQDEKKPEE